MTNKPGPVILIVEDEGHIALEMMEFLTRKGYRVPEPVPTGEEAVERCRSFPRPDLVLMDVHLAGSIDGIDAARRIREENPIPVIILTACDDNMTGRRMKDLAPDGYLVKPSTPESLLAAISLVLGARARTCSGKTGEPFHGVRGQADQ
jgi:DNA-binding response OmpR family regulator